MSNIGFLTGASDQPLTVPALTSAQVAAGATGLAIVTPGGIVGSDGNLAAGAITPAQAAAVLALVSGAWIRPLIGRVPLKCSILTNSFATANLSWWGELCGASDGMLLPDYCGGVAGNTSAQMLARVASIPSTTSVCLFGEGPNDAAGSVSVQTHISNLRQIALAMPAGVLPVLVLSSPADSYAATVGAYRIAEYWLARVLGLMVLDPWGQFFDPANGNWVSGASGDGIHPLIGSTARTGARTALQQLMAQSQVRALAPLGNTWGGQISNALLQASTGGLGTGWSTASGGGTITPTVAAASGDGFLGNWQVLTATSAVAYAALIYNFSLPAGYADTNTYLVHLQCRVTGGSANAQASLFVRWSNGVGSNLRDDSFFYNQPVSADLTARTWLQTLTPPTGAAAGKLWMQLSASDANPVSGVISIAEPLIANVTVLSGGLA